MISSGRTAVIVGGGTGIGAGCAIALAEDGFRVAIGGRRDAKLNEVAARFDGRPPILTHAVDAGDRDSVETFFAWANQELGDIDLLVNSAGVNVPKRTIADLSPEDWDKMIRINATGAYNCIHTVLPRMRERRDGLIIQLSSIAGVRASTLGGVGYTASKFAMSGLGLTVGREVLDEGVRITNLYPGEVETPLLDDRPAPVSAERRSKMLQPEDVAEMVVAIAKLPPRAHVPEITVKPTNQDFA